MPAVNVMFGGGATAPHSNYAQTPSPPGGSELGVQAGAGIIDGTPMRVATLVVLSIVGLAGLRWAGFKFNVTVG